MPTAVALLLAARDGTPAEAHLSVRGPDNTVQLASALPVLSGQPVTDLRLVSVGLSGLLQLSALASLTQLYSLLASHCSAGGSTLGSSPNALTSLTALQCLGLEWCRLRQLPVGMSRLTRLTRLTLNGNSQLGSSASLAQVLPQLTALQYLSLKDCHLTQLPDALASSLTNLTHLDLGSHNRLSPAILESLTSLTALQWLSLSASALRQLPEDMSALTRLTFLQLGNNRNLSTGSLGAVLQHLVRLRGLWLSYIPHLADPGSLDGLLHVLRGLPELQSLWLRECGLTELPEGMTALSSLTHLDLRSNLDGLAPASLDRVLPNLTALRSLDLSSCCLVEVPAGISSSTCLTHLNLNFNPIRCGWHHLRPLARLCELKLAHAGLAELPPDLTALQALQRLNLWANPVAGGWHCLLALPHLRSLTTGSEPPEEVRRAVPYIEVGGHRS